MNESTQTRKKFVFKKPNKKNNTRKNNASRKVVLPIIKERLIFKGHQLLHCDFSHTYDTFSPAPLLWLQGRFYKYLTGDLTQKNSWYCGPLSKELENVFYFYKTKRTLRLLDNPEYKFMPFLEEVYPEIYDKIPFNAEYTSRKSTKRNKNSESYPADYVLPMVLSQIYGDTYDGIYHHDGEIILWPSYEDKLILIRKEFNEEENPLNENAWELPNRGRGTKFYMPSEEVKKDIRHILRPILNRKK